jgi:N-carbamoyl-L-amino-acid hydrolase
MFMMRKGDQIEKFEPNLERIERDILNISQITSPNEFGYTRISFSEEDHKAREQIGLLMEREAKLKVRIDAVGNLIGRREGKNPMPAILVGSHIDTVPGGGRFDGVAGVIAGIEVARMFEERGVKSLHSLEVIVFLAEEPSPFGLSTIGSRGMVGKLREEHLTSLKDDGGRTLGKAIQEIGGDPASLSEARRSPNDVLGYLELHIEQGPLLFSRGVPIGVVEGIVGIARGRIEVIGRNDHAGTTPMATRKDALAAGSEVVLALEKVCKELDGVVGTIGRASISPDALNVIPGRMDLGMEIRSLSENSIHQAISLLKKELERIRERRGLQINLKTEMSSKPVIFKKEMVDRIRRVCEKLSIPYLEMVSGGGHDAMHIAEIAPVGMVFIPSKDGRSHCPEEWSEFGHVCLGIEVIASTIAEMDKE